MLGRCGLELRATTKVLLNNTWACEQMVHTDSMRLGTQTPTKLNPNPLGQRQCTIHTGVQPATRADRHKKHTGNHDCQHHSMVHTQTHPGTRSLTSSIASVPSWMLRAEEYKSTWKLYCCLFHSGFPTTHQCMIHQCPHLLQRRPQNHRAKHLRSPRCLDRTTGPLCNAANWFQLLNSSTSRQHVIRNMSLQTFKFACGFLVWVKQEL